MPVYYGDIEVNTYKGAQGICGSEDDGVYSEYLGSFMANSAANSVVTWNNVSFGTPADDRVIVFNTVTGEQGAPVSGTCGGIAAPLRSLQQSTTFFIHNNAIFSALVPTGESGTITVTSSIATVSTASLVMVYAVYGINPVPFAVGGKGNNADRIVSVDVNTPESGIVIGSSAQWSLEEVDSSVLVSPDFCLKSGDMNNPSYSYMGLTFAGLNPNPTGTQTYSADPSSAASPSQRTINVCTFQGGV